MRKYLVVVTVLLALGLLLGGCTKAEPEQPYQAQLEGALAAIFNCPDTALMEGLEQMWAAMIPLDAAAETANDAAMLDQASLLELYETQFGGYFTPDYYEKFVLQDLNALIFHMECYNTGTQTTLQSYSLEEAGQGAEDGYYVNVTVQATRAEESGQFVVKTLVYFTEEGLISGFHFLDAKDLLDFLRPV